MSNLTKDMNVFTTDLAPFSNEDLLSFYRNAANTDCESIGHTKGEMNKRHARVFADELSKRGENVPDYYEAANAGKFNGRGSW